MKTFLVVIGIAVLCVVAFFGITALNFTCGAIDNAASVAKKELYPDALLKKYEWFKNASAELDKKQADVSIYAAKIKSMRTDYQGQKRSTWDRTDKETFSIWEQELAGIRASYNSLSAEYNAQMAKINWAFCNIGKCPPGATNPLPREYKPYEEN
jgi:hypothetical protein